MQSETKHTPGPWVVYQSANLQGFSIAPENTLPTLCAVERCGDKEVHIEVYNFPGATEANARLIAAAPDMLEANQAAFQCITDLIEVIKRGASDIVINEALASCKNDALPLLKKAIAKASAKEGTAI